jgi:hypothetical protein
MRADHGATSADVTSGTGTAASAMAGTATWAKNAAGSSKKSHADLSYYTDLGGTKMPVRTMADWSIRQHNIMENVQQVIQACTSRMFDIFVQGFPF